MENVSEITSVKYRGIQDVVLEGKKARLGMLIINVSVNEAAPVPVAAYFNPIYEGSILKYFGKLTWVRTKQPKIPQIATKKMEEIIEVEKEEIQKDGQG